MSPEKVLQYSELDQWQWQRRLGERKVALSESGMLLVEVRRLDGRDRDFPFLQLINPILIESLTMAL